jgi:hypothetical protein
MASWTGECELQPESQTCVQHLHRDTASSWLCLPILCKSHAAGTNHELLPVDNLDRLMSLLRLFLAAD